MITTTAKIPSDYNLDTDVPVGLIGERPVFTRAQITEALGVSHPTFNRIRKLPEMEVVSVSSDDVDTVWGNIRRGQTLFFWEAIEVGLGLTTGGSLPVSHPAPRAPISHPDPVSHIAPRAPVPHPTPSKPERFKLKDFGEGHVGFMIPTAEIDESSREEVDFGFMKIGKVLDSELSPYAKTLVPTLDEGYQLTQEQVLKMGAVLGLERHLWIYGPTGSGKSSMISRVCAEMNFPVLRINMSSDTTISSFVGQWGMKVIDGVQTIAFLEGPLLRAMMEGALLIIDEITATPAPILMSLQKILESTVGGERPTFVCSDNEGKIYHAHPRFRVVATDNTNGEGDASGSYAGTNIMNRAFLDRFTIWSRLDYPNSSDWVSMLVLKTGVSVEQATKIVEVCSDVNSTSSHLPENLTITNGLLLSPRSSIEIAKLGKIFGLEGAFKMNQIDRITDPRDKETLIDILKARGVISA